MEQLLFFLKYVGSYVAIGYLFTMICYTCEKFFSNKNPEQMGPEEILMGSTLYPLIILMGIGYFFTKGIIKLIDKAAEKYKHKKYLKNQVSNKVIDNFKVK